MNLVSYFPEAWRTECLIEMIHHTGVMLSDVEIEKLCPKKEDLFRCLSFFPPEETRVVILGQDPYHTKGVADGLAFSYKQQSTTGRRYVPPSLRNIFKVAKVDMERSTDLSDWASQKVLLLNDTLSTIEGRALAHADKGWQVITDHILLAVPDNVIVAAWGDYAQKKIDRVIRNHKKKFKMVLRTSHPSPFSASKGFMTCDHFDKINEMLDKPIVW